MRQRYSVDVGCQWMGVSGREPVLEYVSQFPLDESELRSIRENAAELRVTGLVNV